RSRSANLARDVAITARLAERDRQQGCPDAPLERGALEVERHVEGLQLPREIASQLPFRFYENGIRRIFDQRLKPNALRIIVLPKDRGEALLARHQLEPADRGGDALVCVGHVSLLRSRTGSWRPPPSTRLSSHAAPPRSPESRSRSGR